MNPGGFGSFFIDRIRSVNSGGSYLFSDASATRERLHRIAQNPATFQEESERLADDFQRRHGGGTAAGAFLVFTLSAGDERFFALLKYDDETVLTYDMEDAGDGRKRATLAALERTFVQGKNALQKSALIRLTVDGGELTVFDRLNPQKVARYFEGFLDARRLYDDADLTEKLVQVTRDLIKANKDLVPEPVYREMTKRTYDAAAAGGKLDADNQLSFLATVTGQQLPEDHPLMEKYKSALRRARIDGNPITLDAAKVSPPRTRRLVTRNNIQIRIPIDMEGRVQIEEQRIIINDPLDTRYDDAEVTR